MFDEKRKYQMALSKYLMELREAHSCDMVRNLHDKMISPLMYVYVTCINVYTLHVAVDVHVASYS